MSVSPEEKRKESPPHLWVGGPGGGGRLSSLLISSAPALPCSGNALGRVFSPAEQQPPGYSHSPFHLAV